MHHVTGQNPTGWKSNWKSTRPTVDDPVFVEQTCCWLIKLNGKDAVQAGMFVLIHVHSASCNSVPACNTKLRVRDPELEVGGSFYNKDKMLEIAACAPSLALFSPFNFCFLCESSLK